MKRLLFTTLLLLLASPVAAWNWPVITAMQSGGGETSNITFYLNCDSATSGQSPTIGSGTVTVGASVSTTTGAVDDALTSSGGNSANRFFINSSGNIDWDEGTIGFYFNRLTSTGAYIITRNTSNDNFSFEWSYGDTYTWAYMGSRQTMEFSESTQYYVELAWDSANTRKAYRIDGGSWVEQTGLSGTVPNEEVMRFMNNDAIGFQGWLDQIKISSVYQDDLHSVRDDT